MGSQTTPGIIAVATRVTYDEYNSGCFGPLATLAQSLVPPQPDALAMLNKEGLEQLSAVWCHCGCIQEGTSCGRGCVQDSMGKYLIVIVVVTHMGSSRRLCQEQGLQINK